MLVKNETNNYGMRMNISNIYTGINKYIVDKRYIQINNKYIFGVNKEDFNESDIIYLRDEFRKNKLRDIYILCNTNDYYSSLENNFCEGLYYSPSIKSLEKVELEYNKTNAYFYTHLLYHNLFEPPLINENFYRTSIPMIKYPIINSKSKTYIFGDYSPEKYYFLNKIIIDWTKKRYNINNQYIFIDDFNNLLRNDISGYANINSFSKALYGLPLISDSNKKFNLENFKQTIIILIQVHIYYTDLMPEIINKINNMPVPFDLYITTNTKEKKINIEKYLKENSNANKYEILITENKGRDVIPFLLQLKNIIKKYKYLCHIHTKKHLGDEKLGKYWKNYLYENLLGSKNIIKQILSDFENHNKLGFIFPEHFFSIIKYVYKYSEVNVNYIDTIFEILYPKKKLRVGNIINFPAGNMFWARIDAIYQLFNEKIFKLVPEERSQYDKTILHAIERFWLYLVKLNGFTYKTIFYYM